MKILKLIIKQAFLDQIIGGRKTEEHREIKPTTARKYIHEKANGEIEIIHYDAIQFYAGYHKNRDSILVEVKKAEIEGNISDEYKACQMVYSLGKVLQVRKIFRKA